MIKTQNKLKQLFVILFLLATGLTHAQANIAEDRMYFKISPDVVKVEQDIYLPKLSRDKPRHLIRWVYDYRGGLLITERSYTSPNATLGTSEKIIRYNKAGKIIKDSLFTEQGSQFGSYTEYEYDNKAFLKKAVQKFTNSKETIRIDTYSKYKGEKTYEKFSQFFDDDNNKSVAYTSVFEEGIKRSVIFKNDYPPILYRYDDSGLLVTKGNRKFFYKTDERGNPTASVAIENGMRIYNFFRLTYADGLVTGSLAPDEEFVKKWDNEK